MKKGLLGNFNIERVCFLRETRHAVGTFYNISLSKISEDCKICFPDYKHALPAICDM